MPNASNNPASPADTDMVPRAITHEIHRFWWLYLPIAFFCLRYGVSFFGNKRRGPESWMVGELGLIENLTVLMLIVALVVSARILLRMGGILPVMARIFLVLYCLGAIYFAGEEASWGQHWFGWESGEFFATVNDQQETNFHNTSEWLDRIPKGILSLLIFVGGIVMPLIDRYRGIVDERTRLLWWARPTWVCLPTAVFATVATWPSKLERELDVNFYFDQAQEMKEFYIAWFLLLFILSLSRRLAQTTEPAACDDPPLNAGETQAPVRVDDGGRG